MPPADVQWKHNQKVKQGKRYFLYHIMNFLTYQSEMNMDNAHAISTYFQIIDYTSVRGGVSVLTNKAEITTSYLIIQKAQIEDGGIYSCENGVVDPAKVKVHVLTGKNVKFHLE